MKNYNYHFLAIFISLFFISSCDNSRKLLNQNNQKIVFKPSYNNKSLNCNSSIQHSNQSWKFNQVQFFISAIELKGNKGKWQKGSLIKSLYQTDKIALLGEYCELSNKQSNANWVLNFDEKIDLANTTHIRFDLGLPFAINHLNPLTQESPLNIPTMFWGWQKGHKFLRLEMETNNDNWLFHLGSVGCKAASPLRAPKQECLYPNRYTYELPITKKDNQITLEFAALLNNITINEQASCQSSPDNTSCQTLLNNLKEKGKHSVFKSKNEVIDND